MTELLLNEEIQSSFINPLQIHLLAYFLQLIDEIVSLMT